MDKSTLFTYCAILLLFGQTQYSQPRISNKITVIYTAGIGFAVP
jgi:hypothetical protein